MKEKTNSRIAADLVTSIIVQNKSKQHIMSELFSVDQKLSQIYANQNKAQEIISQELMSTLPSFSPNTTSRTNRELTNSVVSLGIPKNNSLTDSLLRSTLGCEQKLAKSYLQILDDTQQLQQIDKQKRIDQAKKRFAESNKFKDSFANSRSMLHNTYNYAYHQYHNFDQRVHPVIDNEHESYLKTQLMYLEKPKSGKKVNQKQYYDKHVDNITKKIKEIGGMEDTVGCMQDSLGKYQLRNFKKRAVYAGWTGSNFTASNNPYKNQSGLNHSNIQNTNSWTDRSRAIRQALMTKMDIQQ